MASRTTVVDWNGQDLPREMSALPPGRYVLEPVEEWDLSPEEVAGLEAALEGAERGGSLSGADVAERLRQRIAARTRR